MSVVPDAGTLNCPMCGASASKDTHHCDHCGAVLATVACPSCFGMVFQGAKFCAYCGAGLSRSATDTAISLSCPRCRENLTSVQIGNSQLWECGKCSGLWADTATLDAICTDRERQAAALGSVSWNPGDGVVCEAKVQYIPCPVCHTYMNRVNFARCSNVVVDICRVHGTWFDRDELRKVVEFIRAGGFDAARQREINELEEQRRRLKSEKIADAWDAETNRGHRNWEAGNGGLQGLAELIRLFRKSA